MTIRREQHEDDVKFAQWYKPSGASNVTKTPPSSLLGLNFTTCPPLWLSRTMSRKSSISFGTFTTNTVLTLSSSELLRPDSASVEFPPRRKNSGGSIRENRTVWSFTVTDSLISNFPATATTNKQIHDFQSEFFKFHYPCGPLHCVKSTWWALQEILVSCITKRPTYLKLQFKLLPQFLILPNRKGDANLVPIMALLEGLPAVSDDQLAVLSLSVSIGQYVKLREKFELKFPAHL